MNIQEIVSVVTLGVNIAWVGYIYGRIKAQLENQKTTFEEFKQNQKNSYEAFKQNFNEKFNDFKDSVAEHFLRVERKQDLHNKVIERTYSLECREDVQDEQIKVINHRIEDLEELNK